MVRLALVVLVCAACFADNPPVGLGSGTSSAATTTDATTGAGPGSTGEGTSTTGGASGSGSTGPDTTGTTGPAVTSGEPDTTGSASTGGDPGTTGERGTTGSLMWDDCEQFDTEVDCIGCCGQVIEASQVYYAAFAACLCKVGNPCMQTCGFELCLLGTVTAACLECAAGPGAECQTSALNKCQDDDDCGAFLECMAENHCSGKP